MRRLIALLALTLGCPSPPAAPPATATPAATAALAAAPPPSSPAPAALLDPAEVQSLVDRWLTAQNSGDFEAYQATYASRFFGIKRAGPRTSRFDRAGWLLDRERMFRKPMQVTATDVTIAPASNAARVAFTQTWSSGSYRDAGPKQLVVVREDEGLLIAREEMLDSMLIAREEMLDSTLLAAPDTKTAPSPGEFSFVETLAGTPWLVLDPGIQLELADAPATLLDRGSLAAATRTLATTTSLPASIAALTNKEVDVREADGAPCRTRVGEPVALMRFSPHFGMLQAWDATDGTDAPPAPDGEVAEEIWSMGPNVLVAFPLTDADCQGTWARLASLPAPTILGALSTTPFALEAARGTAEWQATQAEFAAEEGSGPWEGSEGGQLEVRGWEQGADSLVVVHARAGWGCGSFEGGHWSAWRESAGNLTRLSDGDALWNPLPDAAIDLGGGPLLLTSDALFAADGTRVLELTTPSYDCGC